MAATTLTRRDLIDIAHGATFLCAGGGGTLASALAMVQRGFPARATVELLSVDDAAAAPGLTAACCYVGSETTGEDVLDPRAIGYALDRFGALMLARSGESVRRLAPVDMGVQGAVIPCLLTAQRRGLPVVDADGAGRAVPGLMLTTWALYGPSPNPAVAANSAATATVVVEADTTLDCHMIVNGVCLANNFGVAAVAMWGTPGDQLRETLPIVGTISLARSIGRALRTSTEPVEATLELLRQQGLWTCVVSRGQLESVEEVRQDYLKVTIRDAAAGATVVLTAGENLVAHRSSGELLGMSPDMLCWLTPGGKAFSNTEIKDLVNQEVVLIGVSARAPLRDPRIISLFGYFLNQAQAEGKYVPIEQLSR